MLYLEKRLLTYLPGIGPKKAEVLQNELGLLSYEDLLFYFPYKYVDRSRYYSVSEIKADMPYIQLKGSILSFETIGEGSARRLIARFSDGTGVLDLVWFKGITFVQNKYKVQTKYIIFGKPTSFGHTFNIVHPDIDMLSQETQVANGLTPFYNTTERMKRSFLNSRALQNAVYTILQNTKQTFPETLPAYLVEKNQLLPFSNAIRNIHFPESSEQLEKARLRLKFEELFYIQLNLLRTASERRRRLQGIRFNRVGEAFNSFYNNCLPFTLTNAQKRVVKEIHSDMGSGTQMNRLLQGDVGSGKTLVALLSMLLAVDNGCQACLMAPTEILAQQHYRTILELLQDLPVRVVLLTGSTKRKERKTILPDIANGEVQIIIGTHALIEETVSFSALGLAIIDEQHRFGVEQRSLLWTKHNDQVPHILVMTATPIPRTLAMTLYGDLDISVIDELPPGRKPIQTLHRFDNKRAELYNFIRKELQNGRQAYIVYPLIEGNEKLDYKDLQEGYETFCEVFPEFKVCMVHGKMKAADKEREMQCFASGEAQILMATTVIEVGVNVPNASVMVIESAERFGLSQLHQLRGRVGRGAEQSYCILVSSFKLSGDTRKRLEIMVRSTDGFEIAEADMRLRGYGNLEGTQQSGESLNLHIANLAKDGQILSYARNVAADILDKDPELHLPEHQILNERLKALFKKQYSWGRIS